MCIRDSANETLNTNFKTTTFPSNGDITSIILTNGTESITLENGGTYQKCNLPANSYLEAVVTGNHESFRFTVDGVDRTENAIPYNFPAVSNGETWNPGFGVHNIAGSLFSANGANGTLYDHVNLQITITDCNANTACTGDISSIILTNGSQSITLENGGSYQLCCLLYTSPSPRDRTRSRMPSSA